MPAPCQMNEAQQDGRVFALIAIAAVLIVARDVL